MKWLIDSLSAESKPHRLIVVRDAERWLWGVCWGDSEKVIADGVAGSMTEAQQAASDKLEAYRAEYQNR